VRENAIDQDLPLAEDRRLIKRLWKVDKSDNFPDGLEFVYQFLYLKGDGWIQVVRIDNQLHEGKSGSHIHILKRENVEWAVLSFEEAEEKILDLAESMIKNIINRV